MVYLTRKHKKNSCTNGRKISINTIISTTTRKGNFLFCACAYCTYFTREKRRELSMSTSMLSWILLDLLRRYFACVCQIFLGLLHCVNVAELILVLTLVFIARVETGLKSLLAKYLETYFELTFKRLWGRQNTKLSSKRHYFFNAPFIYMINCFVFHCCLSHFPRLLTGGQWKTESGKGPYLPFVPYIVVFVYLKSVSSECFN